MDRVFVIGVFDESALDGAGGTQLILSARVEVVGFGLKIASAQLAVAANRISLDTLHSRGFQHALSCAVAAAQTFFRVNLPDHSLPRATPSEPGKQACQSGYRGGAHACTEKPPAVDEFGVACVFACGSHAPLWLC